MPTLRPELIEALEQLERLLAAGAHPENSEELRHWLAQAALHAPRQVRERLAARMRALGLVPRPIGYTAEGEPRYAVADVAARLGLSAAAVLALLPEDRPQEAGDLSPVH